MTPTPKQSSANKITFAVIAVLLLVVGSFVLLGQSKTKPVQVVPTTTKLAPAPNFASAVNALPVDLFATAGTSMFPGTSANPVNVGLHLANQPTLTLTGETSAKPIVLFVGAEWCPYCAAQRWPLVAALSRFGQFTTLHAAYSSATDVLPNTPTVSLHNSGYTSSYLSLRAIEQGTTTRQPLDDTPADVQALMDTYDSATYFPGIETAGKSIPFLDIANQFVQVGVSYNPSDLQGKTAAQVLAIVQAGKSPLAQTILTSANLMTAQICLATKGQPGSVCQSPTIKAATALLPAAK